MEILELGRISYKEGFRRQLETIDQVISGEREDTLILCEHNPVLTLGANFHEENLRFPTEEIEQRGIEVVRTDRGGDVTYHGPGQLVIYPIFRLESKDLHQWLRYLEETMLITLGKFGITARRFPPNTGAWVGDEKVAAIGIKVKRWTSMHGIALNCDNDLAGFNQIIPCGIEGYGVTTLTRLLNHPVTIEEAKPIVIETFRNTPQTIHGA
ncbi:lipoyl(octanoyl) transferase LipB [soil metagenome]